MSTPLANGFWQPAEWELHHSCWLAFPSHEEFWEDQLAAVQTEFLALARVIGQSETLEILVGDHSDISLLSAALPHCLVNYHLVPYGDIWLRDTAPIFVRNAVGQSATTRFSWNGWGNKYLFENDSQVAEQICKSLNMPSFSFPWVLEGGAIEVDGCGTCLTTQQCLLNSNRNPHMDKATIEAGLQSALGVQKILWLDRGLQNDHTDGHIDTLARFVAPGKVLCMQSQRCDDPNQEVLTEIAETLREFTDAQGRQLEVLTLPSPGLVLGQNRQIMPASYLNFYIANKTVIVPTYDAPWDEDAVQVIAACFPTKETIGLSAKTLLEGGGAFHCITQQQPIGV